MLFIKSCHLFLLTLFHGKYMNFKVYDFSFYLIAVVEILQSNFGL